uniref:Uncharacterized protein n=1 Tax=Arundo donax TaxID=35708 RepID=A0A0A9AU55_ARUDO
MHCAHPLESLVAGT